MSEVPLYTTTILHRGENSNMRGVAGEYRRVPVPAHRFTPLKEKWLELYDPIVSRMKLQVRPPVFRRLSNHCIPHQLDCCIPYRCSSLIRNSPPPP